MMKPDEMGHAFVFCSKVNDKHVDELIALLKKLKEHIKDPSIIDIVEKQEQSLISFIPIKKVMCKLYLCYIIKFKHVHN